MTVWNDLPTNPVEGGIMVELGDLWGGEERRLTLTFAVPAKSALGLAEIAELELRYVVLPEFTEQTVTIPVNVNVVPGDQAAGRIADPEVRNELTYQQTQNVKRDAADALDRGDYEGARMSYEAGRTIVADRLSHGACDMLEEEAMILSDLQAESAVNAPRAAKLARMEHARKSRKSGREHRGA